MSRFFIHRPIFAWVLAIIVMLAGILAIKILPISQYPNIAPPTIVVQSSYTGASARTLEDSVTQVIEQQMTGLDGLLYMSSSSDSSGAAQTTLTFAIGTNADTAQVQVQNRLQSALPLLPESVQRNGVRASKGRTGFLMVLSFLSKDGSMSNTDIGDYIATNIQDPLSRVPGVGNIQSFSAKYAMRVWLQPNLLNSYGISPAEVVAAIQAQNAQVAVGQVGAAPAVTGQQINATITAQSLLQTPEQFRKILLRTLPDGSTVELSDVARVEIGSENYVYETRYDGQAAGGLAIQLATGANALDTADGVRARIQELSGYFPAGLEVEYPFDTTPFVRISIEEVVKTLAEAVVLVFLVMYLFLQNWRATLIPTLAVPVVLLGTFAVLHVLGYSINTLTMFATVLAIGLLVDDAIVVVENVERIMVEEHLPPLQATIKSMNQISTALVGIGVVLSAVFIPMAFFSGSAGVIYRQFSVTIITAMVLSVLVALIFTPALCATLLRQHDPSRPPARFFRLFNRGFDRVAGGYQAGVGGMLRRGIRMGIIYVLLIAAMAFVFLKLPTSFVPEEDQGVMFTSVELPPNSSRERTAEVLARVAEYYRTKHADTVASVFTVNGFNFSGQSQSAGIAFVRLKPWDERRAPGQHVKAVSGRALMDMIQWKEATVVTFAPPAITELGTANGFSMYLQDRSGIGTAKLIEARNQLLGAAANNPKLSAVRPGGIAPSAQLAIDIDKVRAGALGVSLADINSTMAIAWGGAYVNDFLDRGRIKRVFVQGDATARMQPEDFSQWFVRNSQGGMVPFTAFATTRWTYGDGVLERFNGVPALQIAGQAGRGFSSGDAMLEMERLVAQLPGGVGLEWSGLSYQERTAGSSNVLLYSLSALVIFLCLAALYESWSIPLAVLLVVPLGVLGSVLATWGRGFSNDVYFQVALLTTIGLAAKNAILIVEFAKERYEAGDDLVHATLAAVRLRLRPIIMTSLAFGFGVLPLAISTGAGAGSQTAVGTGVLGGMIGATLLGLLFVPLLYVLVTRIAQRLTGRRGPPAAQHAAQPAAAHPDSHNGPAA